jgi:putative ATP-dependent endonuclease of OLD family
VGRNNSGKSRILRALAIALGGVAPELDDLTVGQASEATIDIVLAPPPPTAVADEEAFDSAVAQRLGAGAPQTLREEPFRERFAWRTTIRRSTEGLGARSEAQVLTFDAAQGEWVLRPNARAVTRDQRSLLAVDLIDARRDVVEELARRGSAIRRVLSDLEVPDEVRADIERRLATLSEEIVDKSATLDAVRNALESLESLERLVGSVGVPALHPLPVRLEELARSVAIDLDTGNGALPVRLHGAGSRSLASLQVQGVLYDRRLGHDGPIMRPHPLTLIEEPEAHLHPQASLELGALLGAIQGQVVTSTHSAHLVTAVDPRCVRLIRQDGGQSRIFDLGPARSEDAATHRSLRPSTHASEMEKLKRLVERPFGEVLFGSTIVIGDGATERAFLPIVIRHALGPRAHGVCVIDPGSMATDLAGAAIKFARLVDAPWLLFSDTDGPGRAAVQRLLEAHAPGDTAKVVWVATGGAGQPQVGGAIERMMFMFDPDLCRAACIEVRPDIDQTKSPLEMLKSMKGVVGAALARRLVETHPDPTTWPVPLRTLIERLSATFRS